MNGFWKQCLLLKNETDFNTEHNAVYVNKIDTKHWHIFFKNI